MQKDNLVLSTELMMRIGQRKDIRKLTFPVLRPSLEGIEELWVVCVLYTERLSYAIGWCMIT